MSPSFSLSKSTTDLLPYYERAVFFIKGNCHLSQNIQIYTCYISKKLYMQFFTAIWIPSNSMQSPIHDFVTKYPQLYYIFLETKKQSLKTPYIHFSPKFHEKLTIFSFIRPLFRTEVCCYRKNIQFYIKYHIFAHEKYAYNVSRRNTRAAAPNL